MTAYLTASSWSRPRPRRARVLAAALIMGAVLMGCTVGGSSEGQRERAAATDEAAPSPTGHDGPADDVPAEDDPAGDGDAEATSPPEGENGGGAIEVLRRDVLDARDLAGCAERDVPVNAERDHLDPDTAPPAKELYDDRPTANGPHFGIIAEPGVYGSPLDERAVLHNLEHGAVAVWFDPGVLGVDGVNALRAWAEARNTAGLAGEAGGGILAAPYTEPLPNDAAVAFRGWDVAMDCADFDATTADGFLLDHFGAAGTAPERRLANPLRPILRYHDPGVTL